MQVGHDGRCTRHHGESDHGEGHDMRKQTLGDWLAVAVTGIVGGVLVTWRLLVIAGLW